MPSKRTGNLQKWMDALERYGLKFDGNFLCSLHFNNKEMFSYITGNGAKGLILTSHALPVGDAELDMKT